MSRGETASVEMPITPLPDPPISVLVVGRHQLPAEGLRGALAGCGSICVFDEVASAEDGVAAARRTRPVAVVLHVDVLDVAAIDLVSELASSDGTRVVLLTDADDPAMSGLAIAAGAAGYLTTDSTLEEVVNTISYAVLGDVAVSDQHLTTMLRHFTERNGNRRHAYVTLTPREMQVLALLSGGLSTAQISLRLKISQHTARTHIQNILVKLDVHSRLEAAAYAVRHHLV